MYLDWFLLTTNLFQENLPFNLMSAHSEKKYNGWKIGISGLNSTAREQICSASRKNEESFWSHNVANLKPAKVNFPTSLQELFKRAIVFTFSLKLSKILLNKTYPHILSLASTLFYLSCFCGLKKWSIRGGRGQAGRQAGGHSK